MTDIDFDAEPKADSDHGGFGGPDQALLGRFTIAEQSPLWIDLDLATQERVRNAVIRVKTFDELPEDVKGLIRQGEAQVSAGHAPWLVLPDGYFDWAAEDAALDAEDEAKGFDFDEPDDEPAAPQPAAGRRQPPPPAPPPVPAPPRVIVADV